MYIGSTSNYNARMACHKHQIKFNSQSKIYKTINENGGVEAFKFDILQTYNNLDKLELRKKENEFIDLFKPSMNSIKAYITEEERKQHNNKAVKRHRANNEEYVKKCKERSKAFREKNPNYMREYYEKRKATQ